jgi:hypothetical protein
MSMTALLFATQMIASGLGAGTGQITSAAGLLEVLQQGETVRVVVHYAKCRLIGDGRARQPLPDIVAGMTIDAFEYFPPGAIKNEKGFLAFSECQLIEHRTHGHVFNYVRVRVFADGSVQITSRYLKPGTYELVMNEAYAGSLNDGRNDESAVYFYRPRTPEPQGSAPPALPDELQQGQPRREHDRPAMEAHIQQRSEAEFSNGICPECARRLCGDGKGRSPGNP